MPRYCGVAFDLDGTLVDAFGVIAQALNATLREYDLPQRSVDEIKRRVGRGMRALLADFFPADVLEDAMESCRRRYYATPPSQTRLLPAAAETLKLLFEAGVKLAVASNKPERLSQEVMAYYGLSPMLSAVLGDDGKRRLKPDGAMLTEAMARMGCTPGDSLYVGDMWVDVATARSAGCHVAVVPTGSCTEDELRAAEPDYLIRSLRELPAIVLEET